MPRVMARSAAWVVTLSLVSLFFTLPHSLEDFVYGVPARFGLQTWQAGLLVAIVFVPQLVGAVWVAAGKRSGLWLNLGLAAAWVLAAALDHAGELLFAWPYREGMVSKIFEVGIIVVALVWFLAALRALRKPTGNEAGD